MTTDLAGEVPPLSVEGGFFAEVPAREGSGPVEVQTRETAEAEGFDKVFGGEAEDSGDACEVGGSG